MLFDKGVFPDHIVLTLGIFGFIFKLWLFEPGSWESALDVFAPGPDGKMFVDVVQIDQIPEILPLLERVNDRDVVDFYLRE